MPTTVSYATLTQTPVTWGDGSLFNGFLLLGLVSPQYGNLAWQQISLAGRTPAELIPVFLKVPIENGVYRNDVGVLYNSSLAPPNTQYVAWWYDNSPLPRLISGPTPLFTVSTATLTPPVMALPVPVAGVTPPTPDQGALGTSMPSGYYTLSYATTIVPDLANSAVQEVTAIGPVLLEAPIYTGGSIAAGSVFTFVFRQDMGGTRNLTFGAGYVGVTGHEPVRDPGTYTIYTFRYNLNNKWELTSVLKGLL